jgi:hypothetical protein
LAANYWPSDCDISVAFRLSSFASADMLDKARTFKHIPNPSVSKENALLCRLSSRFSCRVAFRHVSRRGERSQMNGRRAFLSEEEI